MNAYTPQTWTVINVGLTYIVVDEVERPVCQRVVLETNARLIAAAPELLALLKRADEELRLIRMKDTGAVYDVMLRTDISALITKAEGRT